MTLAREKGLYHNGRLWWLRVRVPGEPATPTSTGTDNLKLATRILRMVIAMREERSHWDWLRLVVVGELTLPELYDHHAAGTLAKLREKIEQTKVVDPNVEPWVTRWDAEHLAVMGIDEVTRSGYMRHVRALLPAGVATRASELTEDVVKARLLGLRDARNGAPLSAGTRHHYIASWRLFFKYARRRVPLTINPLEEADWVPDNSSPRSTYWDHETTLKVLNQLEGTETGSVMTLIFGTGMELGAALATTVSDFAGATCIARGTKNEHRRNRVVFVSNWARRRLLHLKSQGRQPGEKIFHVNAQEVRLQFYQAQIDVGLLKEPPRSARGNKLWAKVKPHTVHDARHTFAIVKALGLDGEKRQSAKWTAHQLGHATEQMVLQIYSKTNVEERIRLLELAEASKPEAL